MKALILVSKRTLLLGCALSLFSVATPVIHAAEGSGSSASQSGGGGWLWELLNRWFGREDGDAQGEEESDSGSRPINNGRPVPTIANNDDSAEFIKERIAEEALTDHGANYAQALESYDDYSGGLAKTLSQLTPEEQQEIFYGN